MRGSGNYTTRGLGRGEWALGRVVTRTWGCAAVGAVSAIFIRSHSYGKTSASRVNVSLDYRRNYRTDPAGEVGWGRAGRGRLVDHRCTRAGHLSLETTACCNKTTMRTTRRVKRVADPPPPSTSSPQSVSEKHRHDAPPDQIAGRRMEYVTTGSLPRRHRSGTCPPGLT